MATELKSYLSGKWQGGSGKKAALVNPSNEERVAEASTVGLGLGAAVEFARRVGGPNLRSMTFVQRGEILAKLARSIGDAREELIAIGIANAGNTRSDAKFDIDGASATLMYYAELASSLGDSRFLIDGDGTGLGVGGEICRQFSGWPPHPQQARNGHGVDGASYRGTLGGGRTSSRGSTLVLVRTRRELAQPSHRPGRGGVYGFGRDGRATALASGALLRQRAPQRRGGQLERRGNRTGCLARIGGIKPLPRRRSPRDDPESWSEVHRDSADLRAQQATG